MNCLKFTTRTFSNLFSIFSCDECTLFVIINYIYIGNNKIYIYEYNNNCLNKLAINKYYKLILKDIVLNQEKYDFLVLTKKEYVIIFDFLPLLMKDKNDLFIVLL